MANTTNLNLTKLAGTEKLKTFPTPYSENMDTIDGAFGAGFGISSKPSVNAEINSLADGLAIISNGNTHAAIASGQFVYVRNHSSLANGLYIATANISANGTLSGNNLTADSGGGLNTLSSYMSNVLNYKNQSISSVSEFESVLDSELETMDNNSERILRVSASATDQWVYNGNSYLTLLKKGSTTTYASAFITILGNTSAYIAGKSTNGWTFRRIATETDIATTSQTVTNSGTTLLIARKSGNVVWLYVLGGSYDATSTGNLKLTGTDTELTVPSGFRTTQEFRTNNDLDSTRLIIKADGKIANASGAALSDKAIRLQTTYIV